MCSVSIAEDREMYFCSPISPRGSRPSSPCCRITSSGSLLAWELVLRCRSEFACCDDIVLLEVSGPLSLSWLLSMESSTICPSCPSTVTAAAWAANSFFDVLPLFFLSRMYSQPRPNSTQVRDDLASAKRVKAYRCNGRMGAVRRILSAVDYIGRTHD